MVICYAAQRPAEDRRASAQKAADTRAERYGDEVSTDAFSPSLSAVCVLADGVFSIFPAVSADALRQGMRALGLKQRRWGDCVCNDPFPSKGVGAIALHLILRHRL